MQHLGQDIIWVIRQHSQQPLHFHSLYLKHQVDLDLNLKDLLINNARSQ